VESDPGVIKIDETFPTEDIDPTNLEASFAVHRTYDDALLDTAESNHSNEADPRSFYSSSFGEGRCPATIEIF
jgi:hypothetical protein